MRNVLVTGGAGFIGSNLVRAWLNHDQDVVIHNLDRLTYAGSLDNLGDLPDPARHFFIQGDINDQALVSRLMREHQIDTIVNLAAETHVDRSIVGAGAFLETNLMGTYSLLEAARHEWAEKRSNRRFLHVSTDEVYGSLDLEAAAFTEISPYRPNSPYAASKAAADHLIRAYVETYGFPAMISNCSNNYGPYQYPEKLIPLMILNALAGKQLPIYGDGGQVRDWIHVEDHVEGLLTVLRGGRPGETYNIGGGNELTNLQVVTRLTELIEGVVPAANGKPYAELISFVADRPGHDRRYALDTRKIEDELGWRPRIAFGDGIQQTVDWYVKNPEWVEGIRARPEYQAWLEQNYGRRESAG